MNTGVYEICNAANGKRYVGSAADFRKRRVMHLSVLRRGKHHSVVLQRAWDKYGEAAFSFNLLLACSRKDLVFYEQRCMDGLSSEYNIAKVAGSSLGLVLSPEHRAKISAAGIERMRSPEARAKKSSDNIGYRHSPEAIEKMRLAALGRVCSPETREKMRLVNIGRKHSAETRAKMSVAAKGNQRAKISTGLLLYYSKLSPPNGRTIK